MPFREKIEKLLFMVDEATRQTSPELIESAVSMDPSIRDLLLEYSIKVSKPIILRLIEQGREEGFINNNCSNEAILLFIGSLRSVLMRPNVTKEERIGLNALFFYGVTGNVRG